MGTGAWLQPRAVVCGPPTAAAGGAAIALSRLTDVVTDPLIGIASDHWRTRLTARTRPVDAAAGSRPLRLGIVGHGHPNTAE